MKELETCIAIRLKTLNDLARFAYSMTTLGHGTYIVHFEIDGKHYYGVYAVFRDYYKYYGLPMFYYIVLEEELEGSYLLVHADEKGEKVEVSKGTRPGWIGIPIVNLEKPPVILEFKV